MFVSFVVGVTGQVVIHAGRHVAPVRGRQRFASGGFEVHHIQRIFWIGQHFIESVGLPGAGRQRSEQRAGRDELEKVTTIS